MPAKKIDATPADEASDEKFVFGEYLAIMRNSAPAEIARLAALLARDTRDFNAASLVTKAIALRTEAESKIIALRKAVVAEAPDRFLTKLRDHLSGIKDAEAVHHSELIQEALHARFCEEEAQADEELYGIINLPTRGRAKETFLADLQRETGQAPPHRSCALETVVRWAIHGLPSGEWDSIEAAFLDYLCVSLSKPESPQEYDLISTARTKIAQLQQHLEANTLTRSEIENINAVIEFNNHIVTRAEVAVNFTPGAAVPKELRDEACVQYSLHWKGESRHEENQHLFILARLVRYFRPFWKQHSDYYLQWGATEIERRRELNERKKRGGKGRQQWRIFFEAFNKWRDGKKVTVKLINDFPKQPGVARDKGLAYLKKILEKSSERFYSN